ncbi:MAG: RNA-binding protein [Rhodospirillales bacterium]|nr:RNA-binding protein [Rhodospirillales bacterium]
MAVRSRTGERRRAVRPHPKVSGEFTSGPIAAAPLPVRRCLVSGARLPKSALLRFVVAPDGTLVPDLDGRLPGRGLWLRSRRDVVNTACATNAFAKAARARVTVPADLADRVEGLMARRCLDLVGLARRAGEAAAGFEKVKAWINAGRGGVVFAAVDGSPSARQKLKALARDIPLIEAFEGDALGAAMGRSFGVCFVIAPGRFAQRLKDEVGRLLEYRCQAAGRHESSPAVVGGNG